ncbi:MAG: site-specific integrase [Syntrophobacteraceae bacterium]
MSVYFVKKKGYRYDFTIKGQRYTEAWFKTKKEAVQAEAKRREEVNNPSPVLEEVSSLQSPTGMVFLTLIEERLDFIQEYKSQSYYKDNRYLFKRLAKIWGKLQVKEITSQMVQQYIMKRAKESHYAANYDLRLMKALFTLGVRRKAINENPAKEVPFLPVEQKVKYVPPVEDIDKVIAMADPETRDYLWTIRETMGRMSEINRLKWDDVDLNARSVTLYTRKKKGGSLTPRKVAMTQRLYEVLSDRFAYRDKTKPWVFWHTYRSKIEGRVIDGPYIDRKKFMKTLCKKAGVRYFRFHPLRHAGASIMDCNNVPLGAIQKILGHENRKTTEIYLHSIGDTEKSAIAVYERARQNSHTESHTDKKWVAAHTLQPTLN